MFPPESQRGTTAKPWLGDVADLRISDTNSRIARWRDAADIVGTTVGRVVMSTVKRTSDGQTSRDVVEQFMKAWVDGDLKGVLATMAEGAVFVGTTGPEPGRSFKGLENIRNVIAPLIS